MIPQQARQVASYYIRQRQRGRLYASQLTTHAGAVGLTIIGADQFGGNYQTGAQWVRSEIDNLPWVALDSGVCGSIPLAGNGPAMSDGSIRWLQWSGKVLSAPPTPTP
jgi:hypothetical protein